MMTMIKIILIIIQTISLSSFASSFCPLPMPPKNGHLKGSCSSALPNDSCFVICDQGYKLNGANILTCKEKADAKSSASTEEGLGRWRTKRQVNYNYNNYQQQPSVGTYQQTYQESSGWNKWRLPQPAYRSMSYSPNSYQNYQPPNQSPYPSGPSYRSVDTYQTNGYQYQTVAPYSWTPSIRYFYSSTPAPYQPPPSAYQPTASPYQPPSSDEHRTWPQHDHVWDYPVPTCDPVTCPRVKVPVDGGTSGVCNPGFGGEICKFFCNPGFELDGPSGIVCLPQSNGWNKLPPKCIKSMTGDASCPSLVYKYRNGGVFLGQCQPGRPGMNCTLECGDSYQLTGDKDGVFTCQNNGMWNKPVGTTECIQIL